MKTQEINKIIFIIVAYQVNFLQGQQIICALQADCNSDECCLKGVCSKITDSNVKQLCDSQKICQATQCQYGCCTSSQECGSYSDCQDDQRRIQITISIVVGCVVFVLLVCYIFTVCRRRKSSLILPGEEESLSNLQIVNPDGTFINQTNVNQTQMIMLNNNQTSITEQNVQNRNQEIQKPTHILPPIQTIFLIDQNKNQPIFVQKKLDINEVDTINHSMQGTRVSKDYFNRKKKNRYSQRGNSLNQSNILQQSAYDQRRSYDGEGQIVSFSRMEQQNSQVGYNEFNIARQEIQQSVQGRQKEDLLKNPDNYLYQILRQLRQQVFIKKQSTDPNRQKENRQLHSETDLSVRNTLERKKIVSLHSNNNNIKKTGRTTQQIQQYGTEGDYQDSQDMIRRDKLKKNRTKSNHETINKQYLNEISITRDQSEQGLDERQRYQIKLSNNKTQDEEQKEQANSNANNYQENQYLNNLKQTNSYNDIDDLNTPHQEITIVTPHTNNDYSHRYLNSPNKTIQNNQLNSRNSTQSNNLLQILQNQLQDDEINLRNMSQFNKNLLEVPTESLNTQEVPYRSKNTLEVPQKSSIGQRDKIIVRKSHTSNDEDIINQIEQIYGEDLNNDDYDLQNQQIQKEKFQKQQAQGAYKMEDLLKLDQQKSQDISDSIYELEKQLEDLNKIQKKEENLTNKVININEEEQNDQFQKEQSETVKSNDMSETAQGQSKMQFKLSQLLRNQSNNREAVTKHPKILTLSQIQNN